MSDTNYYDIVCSMDMNCHNIDEDFTNSKWINWIFEREIIYRSPSLLNLTTYSLLVLPVLELELPDILIGEEEEHEEEDPIDFSVGEDLWADIGLDPALIDGQSLLVGSSTPAPISLMMNSEVLPRNTFPSNS